MMGLVLVIDDDVAFCKALAQTIRDLGYESKTAYSVSEAVELAAREQFTAIFIDYNLPDINGIGGIEILRSSPLQSETPAIMVTSFTDASTTIEAISRGAYDYLNKPIRKSQIEALLNGIVSEDLRKAGDGLESSMPPGPVAAEEDAYISRSQTSREILKKIGKVSSTHASVLITGETGVGKEVVARMIHRHSQVSDGPFIALNCSAIPSDLLESELFGHSKGAFTGALSDRDGKFVAAENGTLFLDEIGDMSATLQAKLLRVLQERELTPVGSTKPRRINARFISATHQPLMERVRTGSFREDLYFRLNVVEMSLPPLRERTEDIVPLAQLFLSPYKGKRFTAGALNRMSDYHWPGNIRELKNTVEEAAIMSRGPTIGESDLKLGRRAERVADSDHPDAPIKLPDALAKLESSLIQRALADAKGNRSEAAKKLGISRQVLYSKMKVYDLDA